MSLSDNYTTSEEYSDSYTTEATSSGEENYNVLGSSLLSNKANRVSSSSSSDSEDYRNKKKNCNLSCPSGVPSNNNNKKKKEESFSESGSYEGSSGSESEDDGNRIFAKPIIATTNKVVPISTLKEATTTPTISKGVAMGTLTPINADVSNNKLFPLSALSSLEIEAIAARQEKEQAAKRVETPLSSKKLTPLSSLNPTELAAVIEQQEKRLFPTNGVAKKISSNLVHLSTLSAEELNEVRVNEQKRQVTPMSNKLVHLSSLNAKQLKEVMENQGKRLTTGNLVSLSSLTTKELDEVRVNQEKRLSSMKRSTTLSSSKLTPLSSLTEEQFNTVVANQEKNIKTVYKLEKISDLSAKQKDELFIQQRKRMMAKQELSSLSLGCPMNVTPVDELTLSQLRELVAHCRANHGSPSLYKSELKHVMSVDSRKTGVTLTSFAAPVTPIVSLQEEEVKKKEKEKETAPIEPIVLKNKAPLVNFNTLSVDKQNEILLNAASKKSFQNKKSSVSAKREFDLQLGASILSSANIQAVYHGLSTNLSCASGCPGNKTVVLADYLKQKQPVYLDLLKKNMDRKLLDSLLNDTKGRNFFFIVPSEALLAFYRQQGALLKIAKLATAYLTVLLKRGETIPADNTCYSCANLLKDNRVVVRRIDDDTLMIDNEITAKLDPSSGGRVYKMIGPNKIREPRVTEVVEEQIPEDATAPIAATTTTTTTTSTAEPESGEEVSDISESGEDVSLTEDGEEDASSTVVPSTTTTTTTTTTAPVVEEPQVVESLPEENERALAIVPIQESSTPLQAHTVQLCGVYKNTAYKNLKVDILANKMLNADYNGAKHMANYIDHASLNNKKEDALVYLKTFSYDELYNKYITTSAAITGAERLTAEETFALTASNGLNYALGNSINMKEFPVDTKTTRISKVQLMNHFAVLCFKNKDNQYVTTSFSLPDETNSLTDTYMSSDESLLLKFKDNILHSVVLNTDASSIAVAPLSESFEKKKSLITGTNTDVTQLISVQVPMADNATQLYAKDLNYAQFLSVVIPLSKPSFQQRPKSSEEGVRKSGEPRTNAAILKLQRVTGSRFTQHKVTLASYEQLKENTTSVHMAIMMTMYDKATEYKPYTFHRVLLRNPSKTKGEYMVRYDFDEALNTKEVSFNSLINYVKATYPPILSVKLTHPLFKKRKVFRFQLPVARQPPQSEESLYEARSNDGLHFDFGLAAGGKLTHIYIRYNQLRRPKQDYLSAFLSTEAYAYKKHNLSIIPSYMSHRLNKFVALSAIPTEKLDTQRHTEFFVSLQKEIDLFMEKEQLTPLLSNAPDTKITLEKDAIITKSGYQTPQAEETKHFQSAMLSAFAVGQSDTASAKDVLNTVVQEYTTLSNSTNLRDLDFALYMNRFKHISNYLSHVYIGRK